MTEDLNLLPCPFCGGTNIVISDYNFRGDGEDQFPQDIVCMDCPAGFCGHDFKGKGLAGIVSAWNRRPAPAPGDHFAGGGKHDARRLRACSSPSQRQQCSTLPFPSR